MGVLETWQVLHNMAKHHTLCQTYDFGDFEKSWMISFIFDQFWSFFRKCFNFQWGDRDHQQPGKKKIRQNVS
jgi:hypothetical protein